MGMLYLWTRAKGDETAQEAFSSILPLLCNDSDETEQEGEEDDSKQDESNEEKQEEEAEAKGEEEASQVPLKPEMLWSASWTRRIFPTASKCTVPNVRVLPNRLGEVELDEELAMVEQVFGELSQGDEFIAQVPNPEDIIFEQPESPEPVEKPVETNVKLKQTLKTETK